MKKILLALCLMAATVSSETSPQLDSIRVAAFNQIGVPAAGTLRITDAIANAIINYGIQRVSTDFPAVEKLDTIVIDTLSEGGALNSDFVRIRWAQLMQGFDQRIPLEYLIEDSLFLMLPSEEGTEAEADDKTSSRYYYTMAGRLMVWPKMVIGDAMADGDSALVVIGYYAVGDFLSSGTDSTNIPSEYRDELISWVCHRLEALRYRYNASAFWKAQYDAAAKQTGFKK